MQTLDGGVPIPGSVLLQEVASTEELAAGFRGWRSEFLQLERGRFRGNLLCLGFDRVSIYRGSVNRPLLQRFTTPPACVTIMRPGRDSSPMLYRGQPLGDDECLVGGPDVTGEAVSRAAHSSIAVSIRLGVWSAGSQWLRLSTAPAGGVCLRAPGRNWVALLLHTLDWIIASVERRPEVMLHAELRRSLEESLLARLDAFAAAEDAPRGTCAARARRLTAVERARTYVRENLTEPLRLSDLCRHVHAQARSLEYGFQEVLGVTPMAYVKMLRLHRVRNLLRSAQTRTRSISEIALDCGFCHLSQFAVDYKQCFGESPSTTRQRARAALERAAASARRATNR